MSEAELRVELRESAGKEKAKLLRKGGTIPAVFYAHDQKTVSLSIDEYTLMRLLQKEMNILDLTFPDGKIKKSIVREIQRDPVTDRVLHVDLLGIKLDEKIKMTIPVILSGTPIGVKVQGGILEHPMREVEVEGLPLDIPEHLEIDVSEMEIGDVVTLEKFQADKFRFITDTTHPVAIVAQAKVAKIEEEETEEEVEEESAEQEEEE